MIPTNISKEVTHIQCEQIEIRVATTLDESEGRSGTLAGVRERGIRGGSGVGGGGEGNQRRSCELDCP